MKGGRTHAWRVTNDDEFDLATFEYRLATEPPKKRYRPWTREEWIERRNEWVTAMNGNCFQIESISNDCVRVNGVWRSFATILNEMKMLDGSPCGAKVVE
jgi:hypothetical protein